MRVCVQTGSIAAAAWFINTFASTLTLVPICLHEVCPLIIINKYEDLIFIKPIERARKQEGVREGGMEGKIEYTGEKKCFSPVVRILLMSVTYSTVTDIKTVVKRCYDVRMTVYRSFSSLYLPRTVQVLQQK